MSHNTVVTGISIDEGILRVLNFTAPSSSSAPLVRSSPFAFSREWGVLKWTIGSRTCQDAMASKEGYYRCFSHSDCLDVTDEITFSHIGYRCKCSPGFIGNPYLKDGCTRIISGKVQPVILGKLFEQLINTHPGNYMLVLLIVESSWFTTSIYQLIKCPPNAGVTIGLSCGGGILFLAAIFVVLTRRWKRSLKK
jgi:hypothetical protein